MADAGTIEDETRRAKTIAPKDQAKSSLKNLTFHGKRPIFASSKTKRETFSRKFAPGHEERGNWRKIESKCRKKCPDQSLTIRDA
jgi:hypothetical protein